VHSEVVIVDADNPGRKETAITTYVDKIGLRWTSDRQLEVTICNTCPLRRLRRQAFGVEVRVIFDPDDPKERRASLERFNIPKDQYRDYDLDP
jgi:hypothetical protein